MRLLQLTVRDFGPHKLKHISLDAPVVGLLGDNGSGKSTLIQAIRFALIGELPGSMGTLASYIRGYGVNGDELAAQAKALNAQDGGVDYEPFAPAKGADVVLQFSVGGQTGVIERRITKTSSTRKLTWDGQAPITSSKEVDAVMAEILGADKRAIADIVFPVQGSLDAMLSGKSSEREELFINLLLLTHFSQVESLCEQKARLLRSQIQDLSAQRDQLMEIYNQAAARLADEQAEFSKLANYDIELKTLQDLNAAEADHRRITAELTKLDDDQGNYTQQQWSVLASLNTGPDGEPLKLKSHAELTSLQQAAVQNLNSMQETLSAQLKAKGAAERLKQLEADILREQETLARQVASFQLEETWKSEAGDAGNVQLLNEKLRRCLNHKTDTANIRVLEIQRDVSLQKMDQLKQQIPVLKLRMGDAEHACNEDRKKLDLCDIRLKALHTACEHQVSECPVCHSVFTADPADVASAEEALSEAQTQFRNAERELRQATHDHREADKELALCAESVKRDQQAIDTIQARLSPDDNVEEMAVRQQIQTAMEHDARLKMLLENDHREASVARITTMQQEVMTLQGSNYDPFIEQAAQASCTRLTAFIAAAQNAHSTLMRVEGNLSTIRENITRQRLALAQTEDAVREISASRSSRLVDIMRSVGDREALNFIVERQEQYQKSYGRLTQATQQVEDIRQRQQRLDERAAEDAVRARVADEMVQLKEAFARRGIPITFVQDRFKHLTDLANMNLEFLDANFVVSVDPDAYVSLNFIRNDDATGAVFSMQKLSGGQKVRLSLAFLLAVQQLIIPELGLLALDEPSMHLNDEGVESLADLFENLGHQLQSADAQIIVCDHNHRLERAFGQTINLSKK